MQPYPPMGPPGPGPGQPGPYAYPYPPAPPSGPRTLGTLSIIFGAIVTAFSLFGAIGGAGMGMMANMMKDLPPAAGASAMQEYFHALQIPSLVQNLVFVGMSVWLILIGVGQRRYRASAARQSVIWGVVGLVVLVGVMVVHFVVIGPAAERMMDEMMRHTGAPNPFGSLMRFSGLFSVIFYAPYPIILIVTFRKPAIVGAMRA